MDVLGVVEDAERRNRAEDGDEHHSLGAPEEAHEQKSGQEGKADELPVGNALQVELCLVGSLQQLWRHLQTP